MEQPSQMGQQSQMKNNSLTNDDDDDELDYNDDEELYELNNNKTVNMKKSNPTSNLPGQSQSTIPNTQQPQDINTPNQPLSSQLDVTSKSTERSAPTNQIPITDHISASEAAKEASKRDMSERDRLRNQLMSSSSGFNDITNTLGRDNLNSQTNNLQSNGLNNTINSNTKLSENNSVDQSPGILGSTGILDSINNIGSKLTSLGRNVESFSQSEQSMQSDNSVEKCERIYKSSMSRDEKVKALRQNNCEQVLKNEQIRLQSMSGYTDKSDKMLDWFLNNSNSVDQERKKEYDELVTNGWKTGWHFTDPSNWFKSDKRYKCYTNTACKACPLKAETWPVDVMERDAYQVLPEDDFTRRYNNLTQ